LEVLLTWDLILRLMKQLIREYLIG
jgi:hypothetical protein